MIKYIGIFRLVLRCVLFARKVNMIGVSTGLTGRSKNLNPTGFHLWLVACGYLVPTVFFETRD